MHTPFTGYFSRPIIRENSIVYPDSDGFFERFRDRLAQHPEEAQNIKPHGCFGKMFEEEKDKRP